ncbi:MAG: excalibur calcium-binding domain-containing protein [Pseudoxanthomonas sp.]
MKKLIVLLLVLPAVIGNAWAHGGGLNKEGCHNNRKTGDYHCHRGGASSQPAKQFERGNQLAPSHYAPAARSTRTRAFTNCAEARAAGAAPVRRGEPGYGAHLDRDNDGVGCEPYKGR